MELDRAGGPSPFPTEAGVVARIERTLVWHELQSCRRSCWAPARLGDPEADQLRVAGPWCPRKREWRCSCAQPFGGVRLVDAGGEQAEIVGQGAVGELGDACAQDGDRLGR
jgi:hypothetical protein